MESLNDQLPILFYYIIHEGNLIGQLGLSMEHVLN